MTCRECIHGRPMPGFIVICKLTGEFADYVCEKWGKKLLAGCGSASDDPAQRVTKPVPVTAKE